MSDPKLLGMTRPWVYKGKTYQVSPTTFEEQSNFRVWLENEAREVIERHAGRLHPARLDRLLEAWVRDCATGEYAYGSEAGAKAMASEAGMKHLAWLGLVKANPDVTPHLVDEIYDDPEAWASFCAVRGALNNPNSQAPAAKAEQPAA
jgi:predicted DNA-binding transcriptional regulator AlpA